MKTEYLPIVMAIAALVPSACTDSFPAGIDNSASGGSGGGGVDTGAGGAADAAVIATGGAPTTGGIVGSGTGGVAGPDAGGAPATGGTAGSGTGGVAGSGAGGAPAVGGTAIAGTGGIAGAVGLDASADGAAGSVTGGTSGCVPAGKASPLAMLPASNEIGNWALSAPSVSIDTDVDLYGHIDGAAPKYIDRGWLRSAYATYQQPGGDNTLQVAIHDLGTEWNADTLFKADLPVSRLALGTNAVVDMGVSASYVAHGWTGKFYVEVSLDDHSDAALVYVRTFVLQVLNRVCTAGTDAGAPDAPSASPAFKMVSAGLGAACALRTDGSVVCWGSRAPAAPPKETFEFLDMDSWPCGVKADGTLMCWDMYYGDTLDARTDGGGMVDGFGTPPGRYASVDVGYARICGVKAEDGSVICWGAACSNIETPPPGSFAQISSGSSWVCGVRIDGTLACWNQCLLPGMPTPPSGSFTSVSVGGNFACAVTTDGTLVCWGDNSSRQATPPTGTFASVSAGTKFACGVKTDGTLACWGDNTAGCANPPSGTFASISVGTEFGCGVRTNGALACWGNDSSGEATPPVN